MSDATIEAIHRELSEFESSLAVVSSNIHKNLRLYAFGSSNASVGRKMHELEALLESSVHAMRIVMNNYRLINTIPFEVLAHIFSFVACGTGMILVSGVCRRWREVTLATPSLWAVLKQSDPPSALPFLVGRAQRAPFCMRLGGTWLRSSVSLPTIASIQSMIPTLRTFSIECDIPLSTSRSEQIRSLARAVYSEAPMLQHFMLYYPAMVLDEAGISTPGGRQPALQRLTLYGPRVEPSIISSNLRMLYLGSSTLSVPDLFKCLEAAPQLETLLLYTFKLADISLDLPSIKLAHLRRLLIFQFGWPPYQDMAYILNWMDVPDSTVTRFLFDDTGDRQTAGWDLGPPPGQPLPSLDIRLTRFFPDLKTLEYISVPSPWMIGSPPWLCLKGEDSGGSSFMLSPPQPPLQSPSDLFNKIPGAFYIAPFVLSVRNVTHLLLSGYGTALWESDDMWRRSIYTWMPFLEPLVALTTLACSLVNSDLRSIFSSLGGEHDGGAGMRCCPLLSDIHLQCESATDDETWHAILTCAETRARLGTPLQRVALNYTGRHTPAPDLREQLQRHVAGHVAVTVKSLIDDWVLWSGFPSVRTEMTAPPFHDIEDLALVEELERTEKRRTEPRWE
ncbi:hypothetical protein DENSPDRAFT_411617 [Dentipellis sp. KUC8613]|nr:hypothetical protein DENSPDRAFT_411617 [Dentipellis sp. KUC8613]